MKSYKLFMKIIYSSFIYEKDIFIKKNKKEFFINIKLPRRK